MAKGKKVAKKAPSLAVPKLCSEVVAHFHRPLTADGARRQAAKLVTMHEARTAHRTAARDALKEGKPIPEYSHNRHDVDPNWGRMTRLVHAKALTDWDNGVEAVNIPPKYSPVGVEVVHALNGRFIAQSLLHCPKPPRAWDDAAFGSWYKWNSHVEEEDENGDAISGEFDSPSGYYVSEEGEVPRICHATDITKCVVDPADNVLTRSAQRYVVGTGGNDGSALFLVYANCGGTKRWGEEALSRMAFAGAPRLANLVFRVEASVFSMSIPATAEGDMAEQVFGANQVLTLGYLHEGDKELTPAQIRKLPEDVKGLRFKALSEPIVGKNVIEKDLVAEALSIGGGKARSFGKAKIVTNIGTMCRVDSCNTVNCLGIRSAQINVVPVRRYVDGVQMYSMVLGVRSNVELNIPKPKGAKKGSKKKVAEPVAAKPKKTVPKEKAATAAMKALAKNAAAPKRPKKGRTQPRLRIAAESDTVEVQVEDAPTDVVEAPAPVVDDVPADADLAAKADRIESDRE